ncbi:MAG: hypothetical protein IJG85_04745 [Eubacteriaceae bacterium]|nr:hypothetical protein [Eubacteriaceae bacterium]
MNEEQPFRVDVFEHSDKTAQKRQAKTSQRPQSPSQKSNQKSGSAGFPPELLIIHYSLLIINSKNPTVRR